MTEYMTIGGLEELTTISGVMYLEVEQDNVSKKIEVSNLLAEVIDARSGQATLNVRLDNIASSIQLRPILLADTTYYVAATGGSDSNNGLTAGTAFATMQHAIDLICSLDLMNKQVTIQVADGTYTTTVDLKKYVGSKVPIIRGNVTTPANTIISCTNISCFNSVDHSTPWLVDSFKITATGGNGHGLYCENSTMFFSNVDFGTCTFHIIAAKGGSIKCKGNYSVTAGATAHIYTWCNGHIDVQSKTITITNTPAFTQFAWGNIGGLIYSGGSTWSGSTTGKRYYICNQGLIQTDGAGSSHYPGSISGTCDAGSYYG